jgi:hypothetical protein
VSESARDASGEPNNIATANTTATSAIGRSCGRRSIASIAATETITINRIE